MYNAEAFNEFYNAFSDFNYSLIEHIHLFDGKHRNKILDVACGTGVSTVAIQNTYKDSQVYAFDESVNLIDYAKKNMALKDIDFFVLDGRYPEKIKKSWDMIFIKSAAHLFMDNEVIDRYLGVLNHGGALCILEMTTESIENFPIFEEAKDIWLSKTKNTQKNSVIKKISNNKALSYKTTAFGKNISLEKNILINAVKKRQMSCLWDVTDDHISSWIKRVKSWDESIDIFMEFDSIIVQTI